MRRTVSRLTPHSRAPHPEHGHDLGLRYAPVQARQRVRPIELSRSMNTLAANLVDDRALLVGQVQFRLTHDDTALHRTTVARVFSCFVSQVSMYRGSLVSIGDGKSACANFQAAGYTPVGANPSYTGLQVDARKVAPDHNLTNQCQEGEGN